MQFRKRTHASFLTLSLYLSRACLGKMIVLGIKLAPKGRFYRTLEHLRDQIGPAVRVSDHLPLREGQAAAHRCLEENATLVLSFPCVCPEPVLVN